MADKYDFPKKGVNKYVSRYVGELPDLSGKVILDLPCGDGRASYEFTKKGARVIALDLFPEFNKVEGIHAQYADMTEPLPVEDESVDYIICQEGIEHVPDKLKLLHEFNRVLKKNGILLLTTPSMSHARARLSYLLLESNFWRRMPPTRIDSIWFADDRSDKMYYGHLFLSGVQHLQTLLSLSGFSVKRRIATDVSNSSLVIAALLYPMIVLVSFLSWLTYRRKNKHVDQKVRDEILRERVRLNISPTTLLCKHVFWAMRKENSVEDTVQELKSMTRK